MDLYFYGNSNGYNEARSGSIMDLKLMELFDPERAT
jgi:hypothetical protein